MGKVFFLCGVVFFAVLTTTSYGAEMSVFGATKYIRTTGAPNVYADSFAASQGDAVLRIRNGSEVQAGGKPDRVSSAFIYLNGVQILGPADFKQQEHLLEVAVTLLDLNDLQVELASIPDSFLAIEMVQDLDLDLSASLLTLDNIACPDSVAISLRLTNTGAGNIPAGVVVGVYDGDPERGGDLIGSVAGTVPLLSGQYEDITFHWASPAQEPGIIFVRVDDNGAYDERDETNNRISIQSDICWSQTPSIESISGRVINAVTGELLSNVEVMLYKEENGQPGRLVAKKITDEGGNFTFANLHASTFILSSAPEGFIAGERRVTVQTGNMLEHQDLALSPVLGEGQIRIVLTWGEKPEDLEAHLTAPNPDGCRHHCFYWNKVIPGANLDLDDRHSFGPETITITEKTPGTYRYYVHDFTNRLYPTSIWLGQSEAKVTVYSGANQPVTFAVPILRGNVWHVFDLDGETGAIIPVGKMTYQPEPGRIDFPVITSGLVASAYWGVPYQSQVTAFDPDDDPLTYSLLEAPQGMTIDPDTGLIEWTPSGAQNGRYYITYKVADGRCGEDTRRHSLYEYFQPGVQFAVTPCSGADPDGDITLNWSTSLAETVFINQGIGLVEPGGSLTLPSPEPPVVYTITAANGAAQTVRSTPARPSPYIWFSSYQILRGSSTVLQWDGGCANQCEINNGIGEVPVSGSREITPPATAIYTITCTNAAGTGSNSRYISVVDPPPPPPPPSPTSSFTVSPTCSWSPGDDIVLTWTSNNTTACSISPEVGTLGVNGTVVVKPTATTTYSLICTGEGGSITRNVTVPQAVSASLNMIPSSYYAYRYIDLGDTVTLTWATSCADSVSMNNNIGSLAPSGTMEVTPTQLPLTYTLTAVNERGSLSRNFTFYQIAPTATLVADPTLIKAGEVSTLSWTSTRATSCSINPDVGAVDLNGSVTVTPVKPTTYTLTCTGYGGTVNRTATIGFVKPVADIRAVPETIQEGESASLSWVFSNATSAVVNQGIGEVQLGQTVEVNPAQTTVYTITATGPGGTATDSVTVGVIPANPPPTVSISADPVVVSRGEAAVLSWSSTNAESATMDQGVGSVGPNGSVTIHPKATAIYTITATGPGGNGSASVKVTVIQPVPTVSFHATPQLVEWNSPVTLNWDTTDADTVRIEPGIGTVAANGSVTAYPAGDTAFILTASGQGGTTTARVDVGVTYPVPTVHFVAGAETIAAGSSVELSWNTTGANSVTIEPDIGSVPVNGSIFVFPDVTTTYTVTVSNPGNSIVDSITVTVVQTEPTIDFTADPDLIQAGGSSTLTWSTENADTVTIDQGIGDVDPHGSQVVFPSGTTTYTATASGPGGGVSAQATVTVDSPIGIVITSPVDGQNITRPDIVVQGTVNHSLGLETGVVVNGIVALVHNSTFAANHVPIQEGDNTITVVATDVEGRVVQKSVAVTVRSEPKRVALSASLESGLTPMTTDLNISSNFMVAGLTNLAYSGPGTVEYLSAADGLYSVKMTTPGLYHFTGTAKDELGDSYTDTVAILAMDKAVLDAFLQEKWKGMKTALTAQDVGATVRYFDPRTRDRYSTIYNSILDQLPQVVADMQDIQMIIAEYNYAKYRIRKNETLSGKEYSITYYIYFNLDQNGLWKIYEY